jgi:cellulose synthase/poly-beta-1,6-N-acetylglucosamine synthase-like glycosyltransferase
LIPAPFVCGYLFLIFSSIAYWRPSQKHPLPDAFCSVVIAVRNEEMSIVRCIESVRQQSIGRERYEIIVVDDHSDDQTAALLRTFPDVHVITAEAGVQGKKSALATGIREARGSLIVVTDGDCVVQEHWLENLLSAFHPRIQMVTGPVLTEDPQNQFERFQALELAGLNVITASGIRSSLFHLANGANMAFRKSAYETAGGFTSHDTYASGDDLFLVQHIARRFPGSIGYAWSPDTAVFTKACSTTREFIEQRIRWASKNKALSEKSVQILWIFIGLTYALLFGSFFVQVFVSLQAAIILLTLILSIAIAEFILLKKATRYYRIPEVLKGYPMSFLMHKLYVLSMGILLPFRSTYAWKGRNVR